MSNTATDSLRETVAKKIAANPSIKTAMLAETLGVPEVEVLRAMSDGITTELDAARAEEIFRALESLGTVYVVVRNAVAVQETKGKFGNFSRSGPFLNVSSDALHLHLRTDRIGSVLLLEMPSGEAGQAPTPSIQFFDGGGVAAIKAFGLPGLNEPGAAADPGLWRAVREKFGVA